MVGRQKAPSIVVNFAIIIISGFLRITAYYEHCVTARLTNILTIKSSIKNGQNRKEIAQMPCIDKDTLDFTYTS